MAGDREIPYSPNQHAPNQCSRQGTHLFTVDENIPTTAERAGNILARALEVWFQVGGGLVVDIYPETSETVFLRCWDPRRIKDLDDVCDAMTLEQLSVHARKHGPKKEASRRVRG